MCKGVRPKPPVVENFGKPPYPAKPDSPIAARSAAKISRFFREFYGKFRAF